MNCEQNVVKFAEKCIEKCNFYIKYFDEVKCYANRPYLVFSELKPETHIYFFWPHVQKLGDTHGGEGLHPQVTNQLTVETLMGPTVTSDDFTVV